MTQENKPMIFYTGIGDVDTPHEIGWIMTEVAQKLSSVNFTLRTGANLGAEETFSKAVHDPALKEVYLPWSKFNNNDSQLFNIGFLGMEIAKDHNKNFNVLSNGARSFLATVSYQLLGKDLKTPSKMVITWSADGQESMLRRYRYSGNNAQVARVANTFNIPIFNLRNNGSLGKLKQFLID